MAAWSNEWPFCLSRGLEHAPFSPWVTILEVIFSLIVVFNWQLIERTLSIETYRGEMHNNERCGLGQLLDQEGAIILYKLAVCFAHVVWKTVCGNFAVFTQFLLETFCSLEIISSLAQ